MSPRILLPLPRLTIAAALTSLGLMGCATTPDIAATEALAADAPYPDLVATRTLLVSTNAARPAPAADPQAALAARAARLRRRAEALRNRDFDV